MDNVFHSQRWRRVNGRFANDVTSSIEFATVRCTCSSTSGRVSGGNGVTEIVLAGHVTCLLMDNGVAIAIDRGTHQKRCTLKDPLQFVVRTICYNCWNDTVIVVHHSRIANNGLSISVFSCDRVRKGDPTPVPVAAELQSLLIPYPGFIEFEELNGRIVTSTEQDQRFQFWDMENYKKVFSVPNTEFKEIRIARGTVAFFRQPKNNVLPVRLCSAINGQILAECNLSLHPNRDLRFLELCGCYLLLKQDGACVRVYDLLLAHENRIKGTKEFLPKAVTFFPGQGAANTRKPSKTTSSFLAVHDSWMEVCSCTNGSLTSLVKIPAQPPKSPADCLQIIQDRELLLVYAAEQRSINGGANTERDLAPPPPEIAAVAATTTTNTTPLASWEKRDAARSVLPMEFQSVETPTSLSRRRSGRFGADDTTPLAPAAKQTSLAAAWGARPGESPLAVPGISVIDLATGRRLKFIKMACDEVINVLLYDPIQREILAGGSSGLHRITTSFERIEDSQYSIISDTEMVSAPTEAATTDDLMATHASALPRGPFPVSNASLSSVSPYRYPFDVLLSTSPHCRRRRLRQRPSPTPVKRRGGIEGTPTSGRVLQQHAAARRLKHKWRAGASSKALRKRSASKPTSRSVLVFCSIHGPRSSYCCSAASVLMGTG